MSEAEAQQETNGTATSDVPEIELIIKKSLGPQSVRCQDQQDMKEEGSAACARELHLPEEVVFNGTPSQSHILVSLTPDVKVLPCFRVNEFYELEYCPNVVALGTPIKDGAPSNVLKLTCCEAIKKNNSSPLEVSAAFTEVAATDAAKGNEYDDFLSAGNSTDTLTFESVVAEACEDLSDDEDEKPVDKVCPPPKAPKKKRKKPKTALEEEEMEARMETAVQAILNEELSITEAARRYNFPKTTLWKRVTKHPAHRRRPPTSVRTEIIRERVAAGESLSQISRSMKIAKSSVHMHMRRLARVGELPVVENAKERSLQERLRSAHRACVVNGLSVQFAAQFFSLSKTTLWRYIQRWKRDQLLAAQASGNEENVPPAGVVESESSPQ